VRRRDRRRLPKADVVAVQADVQRTDGDIDVLDLADARRQPSRQVHAAGQDADEHEVSRAAVALDDLVGDAAKGAVDVGRLENDGFRAEGQVVRLPRDGGKASKENTCSVIRMQAVSCTFLAPFRASPDPSLKGVRTRV